MELYKARTVGSVLDMPSARRNQGHIARDACDGVERSMIQMSI